MTTPRHRVRSKKRNFPYESVDEPIQDSKEKYKIDFFFFSIDQAIIALELRFNQLNSHSNSFEFLYDVHKLEDVCKNELLAHCKDLENVLTDGDSSDLNALELADEIDLVSSILKKKQGPFEVLKFITSLNVGPNLGIAL